MLAACGGGGGGGSPVGEGGGAAPEQGGPSAADTLPPRITGFAPSETVLQRDVLSFTVDFSEALLASSVSAANVQLRDASGLAVPLTIALEAAGTRVRLTPVAPLALAATYTYSISAALLDLAGNPLAAARSGTFFIADGEWRAEASFPGPHSADPVYAADGAGNIYLLRLGHDGSRSIVLVDLRGVANGAWTTTQVDALGLENPASVPGGTGQPAASIAPQFAVNSAGDIAVAWLTYPSRDVHARVYSAASGRWTPMSVLTTQDMLRLLVAIDEAGNATVAMQSFDSPSKAMAYRYIAREGTWSAPATLATGLIDATLVAAAADPQGEVTVLMRNRNAIGEIPRVRAFRFDAAANSWSVPVALPGGEHAGVFRRFTGVPGERRDVVIGDRQDGISIVRHDIATREWRARPTVQSSPDEYSQADTWIADETGGALDISLVYEPGPPPVFTTTLRFTQPSTDGPVWTSRVVDIPGGLGQPFLAVDAQGNAVVLWADTNEYSVHTVWAQRLNRRTGVLSPKQLLNESHATNLQLSLAALPNGMFIANWWANGERVTYMFR